jgi:hypothetical protein
MRSLICVILVSAAIWHVTGRGSIHVGEAVLAVAAAWFVSLFLTD